MLPIGKVKEVERLLAKGGLSQRKIAKEIGVSRATVSAIARGQRPNYAARLLARAAQFERLGPIERCPTCGARVYVPCRLCRVRCIKAREQRQLRLLRRQARERAIGRVLAAVDRDNSNRNAKAG